MGNWLISPRLWRLAFERLDAPHIGLAFDPSHLVWLFIDAYRVAEEWSSRIFHVHAKDTEIYPDRIAQDGILTDFDWWENRLPGFGSLNWPRLLGILVGGGYTGTISVEHEDPEWNGSIERVRDGLRYAHRYLIDSMTVARTDAGGGGRIVRPKEERTPG